MANYPCSEIMLKNFVDVRVAGTEQLADHTVYVVEVTGKSNGESWHVFRRFSWFLDLDRKLQIRFPHYLQVQKVRLPHRWIVWMNSDVVRARAERLNEYLVSLLSLPGEISCCSIVGEFLRLPADGQLDDASFLLPDSLLSDCLCQTPAVPAVDGESDYSIIEWAEGAFSSATFLHDIKRIDWSEKLIFQLFTKVLVPAVGRFESDRVLSVIALRVLARLVSVEFNLDASLFVHVGKSSVDWKQAKLENHIRTPLVCGNRADAFSLIRKVGLPSYAMLKDDDVISQFLAWNSGQEFFQRPKSGHAVHHQTVTGLPGLFGLGPASPVARSVLAQQSPSNSLASLTATRQTLGAEARECVMFAVSTGGENFFISGTQPGEGMRAVPSPLMLDSLYEINLTYRPAAFGEFEVRMEWQFPESTDMETVVKLVWEGCEESFFGIARSSVSADSERNDPSGNLLGSTQVQFPDPRRFNGTATLHLLKSVSRGIAPGTVIVAASADPTRTASSDPSEKLIKHLHFTGVELDFEAKKGTFVALLSSESIFLISGDLLGEKLALWTAIERFKNCLKDPLRSGHVFSQGITDWLGTNIPPSLN